MIRKPWPDLICLLQVASARAGSARLICLAHAGAGGREGKSSDQDAPEALISQQGMAARL
jgi:hypothetical protein